MSKDDDTIIDMETVESESASPTEGARNLPAVIPREASNSERMELTNRQDTLLNDNPERRCVATNSRGEQCRKFAIYGGTVCRTHGGATKRVKEAARVRVENASNRLMGKLIEFAFDDTKPPDVQLKAIQNSLDRAGLKPPAEVVLSQGDKQPYEEIFDGIVGGSRDESRRARGLPPLDVDNNVGSQSGSTSASLPPDQSDGPNQGDHLQEPGDGRDLLEPFYGDQPHQGPRQAGHDREAGNQPVRHITGNLAIEEAARVRQAVDLDGGHRKYLLP